MQGFLAILAGAVALFFVSLFFLIFELEQALLFEPATCDKYKTNLRKLDMEQFRLPSGAVIWSDRLLCKQPGATGIVLFLHGNTGNLDWFAKAMGKMHALGYQIAAVDYRGYGMAATSANANGGCVYPSQEFMQQDLLEAWAFLCTRCSQECGTGATSRVPLIVMGHSLGGALTVELLYNLLYRPSLNDAAHHMIQTYCSPTHMIPDQIVLLQTFTGLRDVVDDWVGTPCAHLLPLASHWPTPDYLNRIYNEDDQNKKKKPQVLIVQCPDDNVISYKHSERLAQVFAPGDPRMKFVPLPAGVRDPHRNAVLTFFDLWSPYLLRAAS